MELIQYIEHFTSWLNKIDDAQVIMNNIPITRFSSFGCLGVQLVEKLSWENHIEHICAKIGAGIGIMRTAKSFVTKETSLNIYNSIILPHFDYCSPVWDKCGSVLKEKLQKLQNRAARVISGESYETRSSDILQVLSWKNVEKRQEKQIYFNV